MSVLHLGWTEADCPDEAQLKDLGVDMNTTIHDVHGKKYTSQKSIGLYKTTGTASDWCAPHLDTLRTHLVTL